MVLKHRGSSGEQRLESGWRESSGGGFGEETVSQIALPACLAAGGNLPPAILSPPGWLPCVGDRVSSSVMLLPLRPCCGRGEGGNMATLEPTELPVKMSHKKSRAARQKEKRKKRRQELARLRDAELAQNEEEEDPIAEEKRLEEERLMEEERQRLHEEWLRREEKAQEEFRAKKKKEEAARKRKEEQERKLKAEWEEQQRREREAEELRQQEKREREVTSIVGG